MFTWLSLFTALAHISIVMHLLKSTHVRFKIGGGVRYPNDFSLIKTRKTIQLSFDCLLFFLIKCKKFID